MSTPLQLASVTHHSVPIWNNIPYMVKAAGWTAQINNNEISTASRTLIVRWADVANMTDYLLNANNFVAIEGQETFYYVGEQHPTFDDQYVVSVQVNPYTGASAAQDEFDYAELVCGYKSLPVPKPGDPSAVREDAIEPISMIVNVPRASLTVSSTYDGKTQNGPAMKPLHDVPVYLPIYKITSTLLGVSTVPLGAINAATNHTSSSDLTFKFGGGTYTIDKDTILYCGASSKRTVMSNGRMKYDVTHTFIVSPIHNKVYDPTSNDPSLIKRFILPKGDFLNYTPASFAGLGV